MAPVEIPHDSSFEDRLTQLLKNTPVADTHNDFPYLLRVQLHNEIHNPDNDFNFNGELQSHTSLQKMRKGKLGLQFFSVYIANKGDSPLYQDFNLVNNAARDTLEQIDVTKRLVAEYADDLEFVRNSEEAIKAYAKGKIAVTLGVEGLHQVDLSMGVLRLYHELGCRYITLTHNCDNPFATALSSITGGLPDKGLSKLGERCVLEMNRLGMIVDLSHVSYKTMVDALRVTKSPVMFSHSSAWEVTNHERNVRDDVLLQLKENNGVCCVNFCPAFIFTETDVSANIDDAVKHILHIVKVTGSYKHVGFGSDFDGIPLGPVGLEDVSKYPDLIYKLMAHGATDEDIRGIMGLNVLRVWKANEDIAEVLQKEMGPRGIVEDNWEKRKWSFHEYSNRYNDIYPGSKEIHKETTEWFQYK